MQILMVVDRFWPTEGGIQRCMIGLCRVWRHAGYQVTVLTSQVEKRPDEDVYEGIRIVRSSLLNQVLKSPETLLYSIKPLDELISKLKADIIFSTNHVSPAVVAVAKQLNIPVVVQVAGWGLACTHKMRLFRPDQSVCDNQRGHQRCTECLLKQREEVEDRRLSQLEVLKSYPRRLWSTHQKLKVFNQFQSLVNQADAHIWMSQFTETFYPNQHGYRIPNGVDTSTFQPVAEEDLALTSIHESLRPPYITLVGRITNTKGHLDAVRVLSRLPEDVQLLIVGGSGSIKKGAKHVMKNRYYHEVMQGIESSGLKERVLFSGYLSDEPLKHAYSGAIASLVPSVWYEPFGNIVVESMACGTPVVAYDSVGGADLIDSGHNGYVVNRLDIKAMAAAVTHIASAGKQMRTAARQTSKDMACFEVVAIKWLKVFEETLGRHR